MRRTIRIMKFAAAAAVLMQLAGCDDPQVYGSIGVSSGYSSWGHGGTGMRTSIAVGGRIY